MKEVNVVVTDQQVATLKAQLQGKQEEHERLLAQLDLSGRAQKEAYATLISMALFVMANARFSKETDANMIRFVANVRASAPELAERIDPKIAERILRAMYSDETIDDIDGVTLGSTQILLLAALVHDAQLDEAELDQTLAKARALADD